MTNKPLKVFVCSTLTDLSDYRVAVRDALLSVGATPTLYESVLETSTTVSPKQIFEFISESDAVLIIVGHRYGSIEPDSRKSWVEVEYEIAKHERKPLLVFMAAENAPWPVNLVDLDRAEIERFRTRVQNDFVVQSFWGALDLKQKVEHAVGRFIAALERASTQAAQTSPEPSKREVYIVRLLLSSPGDVSDERERVANAVFRFNQDAVEELGLFIKLIRWEDMAPQIGPRPQAVIHKQIKPYHLFVGIMWNRFGTPTDIAASGTKEEFDAAIECWKANLRPWITFYFCDRPVNFTNSAQLRQKGKVLAFRSRLHEMGVVRAFDTAQTFEETLFNDLKRITRLPEFLTTLKRA